MPLLAPGTATSGGKTLSWRAAQAFTSGVIPGFAKASAKCRAYSSATSGSASNAARETIPKRWVSAVVCFASPGVIAAGAFGGLAAGCGAGSA